MEAIIHTIFDIDYNQKQLCEMDLEQLLNIQIEVVSTKGEKIFNSPSTVSIISKEEIEKYGFQIISFK